MVKFAIKNADILDEPADLLILKYAQGFLGVDLLVAKRLVKAGLCTLKDISPAQGEGVVIETKGAMAPARVLFLGSPPITEFSYPQMRTFAIQAMRLVAELSPAPRTITTVVHGMGYGLDGGEALLHLVHGFTEGLSGSGNRPLESISFMTLAPSEGRLLAAALSSIRVRSAGESPSAAPDSSAFGNGIAVERLPAISNRKGHVFVAMPFSEDFENVYEYGIYPAVRNCGYVCERVDESHFVGDILTRIRSSIETADLVVADLTEGRPNVYLEVGYAWGKGIPVILLAKKGEKLHFDVSSQRCLFYGKFALLTAELGELIRGVGDKPAPGWRNG